MPDANRYLPPDPATLRAEAAPRPPLGRAETIFAWSLIVNGLLGLLFLAPALLHANPVVLLVVLPLPLVGVVSGVFALKCMTPGFFVGTLFYLVQCVRYYAPAASFGFESGIQFGISFQPIEGETIVLNLFAVVAFVYGMLVLNARWAAKAAGASTPAAAEAPDVDPRRH